MSDHPRDEERLPWLEPVDDYDDEEPISIARLVLAVVIGLVALGLVVGGIFWFRNHRNADGNGALIEAPQGPVKERPEESGGLDVGGTDDVAYGASLGQEINSVIDTDAMPEEPVTDQLPPAPAPGRAPEPKPAAKPAPAPARTPGASVVLAPAPAPRMATPQPAQTKPAQTKPAPLKPVPAPSASSGGNLIQLGAFSSAALANKAWGSLSSRFAYLSGASHELSPVTVDGKTLYRLRARLPGAGGPVCAKLKVAGEACSVLN